MLLTALVLLSGVVDLKPLSGDVKLENGKLAMRFAPTAEAGVVRLAVPEAARDFTAGAGLEFDFESDSTVAFRLTLRNAKGETFGYRITPWAGVPAHVFIDKDLLTSTYMNNRSGPAYMISNWGNHIDLTGVREIEIAMRPARPATLTFGPLAISAAPGESRALREGPFIDDYGQWIQDDWPGKAKSLDDLRKSWAAEDKALAAAKPAPAYSRYGGWKPGTAQAKGFFYAKKIAGRWWLIDPDGALFFSIGMDCVRPTSATPLAGREKLFTSVPATVQERGATMADFYRANVIRRHGSDGWEPKWKAAQEARLRAWGFNTIANWSAPLMFESAQLPYVTSVQVLWTGKSWAGYPDVFSEDYEEAAAKQAEAQAKPRANDPFLIGWFIGNEPRWQDRNLIDRILNDPDPSSTQTFARQMLLAMGDNAETRARLMEELVRRYNVVHREAIKAADPNHMVLGIRYAGIPSEPVLRANDVFDVFSINIYQVAPPRELLDRIVKLLDKPIMIGEFHFGVAGRGMAPSLVEVKDYPDRAAAWRNYMEQAAAHWAVVGAHWFQMADQPATGRYDGENYNLGFVTQQDVPYAEMVQAAQSAWQSLYPIHAGDPIPPPPEPKPAPAKPRRTR